MGRWNPVPFVGGAYSDDTRPWTVQDTVNYIPVIAERPGGRSESQLRDAPGLRPYVDIGNGPIRGLHDVEGALLAVSGNKLYRITNRQVAVPLGTIPGVSRVSMAHNQITGGSEVVIATGDGGYVYNTVEETLEPITDDGFPGLRVADFVDGYIAGVEPGGRYWLHSGLADANSWSELDRSDSEAQPDKIVSLIVDHREVWVLNKRTIEPFENTGAATGTFQRVSGTVIEVGCDGRFAVCKMDNSVIWVGGGIVYRANGYSPVRISTHAIEQALSRCDLSRAYMYTYEDRGHKIAYLTCPDGYTWGYDAATNEWHRRESYGMNRWRLSALVKSGNNWVGGDFAEGKLYLLDWNYKVEGDTYSQPLVRRRVSGVLHDNQNPVWINAVELVLDTGGDTTELAAYPIQPDPPTLEGNAPGAVLGAEYSYTYAADEGEPPYKYKIVAGGLPPGLSINSLTSEISGTPTENGSFSFTVRVTDSNGLYAEVDDSIAVGVEWWLMHVNGNNESSTWISTDPMDWGTSPVTRAPSITATAYCFGPKQVADGVALVIGNQDSIERIDDVSPPIVPEMKAALASITTARRHAGISILLNDSPEFLYSDDGFETSASYTEPGGRNIHDVQRLSSGRWIAYREDNSDYGFIFSDDDSPINWQAGTVPAASAANSARIACNGLVAFKILSDGIYGRTEDGQTWTELSDTTFDFIDVRDTYASGDLFVMAGQENHIIRSTDGGDTWHQISIPAVGAVNRIEEQDGTFVLSCTGALVSGAPCILVSTDQCATFEESPLPFTSASADQWAAAPVSRV